MKHLWGQKEGRGDVVESTARCWRGYQCMARVGGRGRRGGGRVMGRGAVGRVQRG